MTSTFRGDFASGASAHAASSGPASEKSYFETQREAMCQEIAISLENVLQNMNKLNRALEGVIAVGNEFSSVEALWSQFENVMGQGQGQGHDQREEDDLDADKGGEGSR